MVDSFGTILVGGTLATVLAVVVSTVAAPLGYRLATAAIAGMWTALVAVVNTTGLISLPLTVPVMFGLPLAAIAVLAATSPRFRAAVLAIPVTTVIGINVVRVLGFFFLLLAAAGRLGGPFPYFAGIGDIITGLFALPVARLAMRAPASDVRILAWNAFGMLDLALAVFLGVTSGNNSPLQLIHAGAGSAAIATLPWSFIPLVLVPVFLIGHITVFAHARTERSDSSLLRHNKPVHA
jgi:hypothetical protein